MSDTAGYVVRLFRCELSDVPPHDDWLTPAERAVLAGLVTEKRRSDWRLGRWCAKQAVLALRPRDPAGLEILAGPDGAPVVRARGEPDALASMSLTHRDGRAAAVAGPPELRIGCDLERVEARSDAFIRDYFTATEAAYVLAHAHRARHVLANLCWSAKESVLKAERSGLRADTRAVAVSLPTSLEPDRWHALHARSASTGDYTGCWRLAGDWLVTVLADRPHELQSVF